MSVVVFGSINMDLVVKTPRVPSDGETLTGQDFFTNPGGKGANQAVASARMGAVTKIVGRIGSDVFGTELLENLRTNNIDTDGIIVDGSVHSGTAMILVDDNGQNRIVVIPAANGCIGSKDIQRLKSILEDAKILLLQLEIPMDMVLQAAKEAKQANVKVILDPAPAQKLPDELYSLIDIITPNQSETELLTNLQVNNENDAAKAAVELLKRGVGQVIIKMGDKGVYWTDGKDSQYLSAFKVKAVDTVAAGDAFNGCLAAALSEDKPISEALRRALAGGALSVTKQGAQKAMPKRNDVLDFLKSK